MTYFDKVLVVDLATGRSRVEGFDAPEIYGLGGKALGARLLEHHLDPKADALSPDNVIILTPSRLVSYAMPGSNRFGAFTRSPLTGAWLECYCGGNFARVFTETGWDAVVILGAADGPVRLHIDSRGAQLSPATDLWGQDTFAVEEQLLAGLDKRSAVLSIGVAGENLVRVASVMHEQAHALGRGGMGAVFGSKRLKAVTATSAGSATKPASEAFVAFRRETSKLAAEGPVSAVYRRFGTAAMVSIMNTAGGFPTDFFLKGAADYRATLEAEAWPEWARIETSACPPCPIRCRKHLVVLEGPDAGRKIHGAEYETLYSFGGSSQVHHALDVAKLNELCNRYGIDSISTGNLVSAAIKRRELGLSAEGPEPGDVEAIGRLLGEIANRSTPLGDALAEGLDGALDRFGMKEWSTTSKHMDPAGYEPRRLTGMALSYALSVRGACHLRATFYKAELSGLLNGLDDDGVAEAYMDWENRMLVFDCLTMCRFYRDLLSWDELVTCATELAGAPVTCEVLQEVCRDTLSRIRRLNFAFGLTPADDTVAERFFVQATDTSPSLDREAFERRVRHYWVGRGWGEDGWMSA
jgi:aldehyde:ferredoxin oxidoreductase